VEEAGGGPATGDGVVEGVERELGAQVGGDGPADDHPGVAVDDGGEVQEPFLGAEVGDVGDPCLVRRRGGEVTGDDVRRRRRRGVGDGGARPAGPSPGRAASSPRSTALVNRSRQTVLFSVVPWMIRSGVLLPSASTPRAPTMVWPAKSNPST
jgi:hypothetical protein